jgi:hypothetical protein
MIAMPRMPGTTSTAKTWVASRSTLVRLNKQLIKRL